MKYFLTIDQGTTSCRTIIFDENLAEVSKSQHKFTQYFPEAGWVEHSAEEIWEIQLKSIIEAVKNSKISIDHIESIGITNQRETVVAWNKTTGKPIHRAIVWQDTRTLKACQADRNLKGDQWLKSKTGLVWDPYFSASKMRWILENVPEAAQLNSMNNLCFGTIDSWLLYNLTDKKVFGTDATNASRTNLLNIKTGKYDPELLSYFGIKLESLPEVFPSDSHFGNTEILGKAIPIAAIMGDQQASLYGHMGENRKYKSKCTLGTGAFLLMNTGEELINTNGLLQTIGNQTNQTITYALEGSILDAGSLLDWLRIELKLFENYSDIDSICNNAEENGGVIFVPAFSGLGSPYWDSSAKGSLMGLTRNTTHREILVAAIQGIAFQIAEILDTLTPNNTLEKLNLQLNVDGGLSQSSYLMQQIANLAQCTVFPSSYEECTALGIAKLIHKGNDSIPVPKKDKVSFSPKISKKEQSVKLENWRKTIGLIQEFSK